ncbi:DUF3784 domain-containing protein [Acetobacterium carbinolicum]|uniref:DUF3784 domain-containing protein n=1 Tax=Acetobacterium carbinolicum TaxID=52690 RepID=UPI0039BF4E51
MFLFMTILMGLLGILFIFLGWRLWKKEQITLIHDYHYTKVVEADKKAYTEKMGKAMILMGIGIFLTGLLCFLTDSAYGWIAFAVCFTGGLAIMIHAQLKYNHGIF